MNRRKMLHEVTLFGKDYQWVTGENGALRLVPAPPQGWVSVGYTADGGLVSIAPVGTPLTAPRVVGVVSVDYDSPNVVRTGPTSFMLIPEDAPAGDPEPLGDGWQNVGFVDETEGL